MNDRVIKLMQGIGVTLNNALPLLLMNSLGYK